VLRRFRRSRGWVLRWRLQRHTLALGAAPTACKGNLGRAFTTCHSNLGPGVELPSRPASWRAPSEGMRLTFYFRRRRPAALAQNVFRLCSRG